MRFLKAGMKVLGLPGWHLRAPFVAVDADAEAHVDRGAGVRSVSPNGAVDLSGRVAVVTGGNGGIGLGIATAAR